MSMNKSAVNDAPNSNKKKRAVFVKIAKEFNIRVSVIQLNSSYEESFLRNMNRVRKIPKIAYDVYYKYYEKPTIDEGFEEIIG